MLRVVSGRFHPGLENAFKSGIVEIKRDPLVSLLVVAPSTRLLDRLHILLSETNRSFLNLHFHTFSSLAQTIVTAEEAALSKPVLSDALFYDTLVKLLLKEGRYFHEMENIAVPAGFPPAVRSTLRDLLDAGIDEDNVEMAIREEFVGQPVDLGTLRSLLNLFRSYLKRLKSLPVLSKTEILKNATDLAPSSSFLKRFREILYYGFYDLTGLQTNFFESVVKNHPATLFFPYVHEDPAYEFAKRFRDTFLQPLLHEDIHLDSLDTRGDHCEIIDRFATFSNGSPGKRENFLINVSGYRDEAWTVATEILRLHEEKGVAFSDMAVVARTDSRLGESLPKVLKERHIPFDSSLKEPLRYAPAMNTAVQLLELTDRDISTVSDTDFLFSPEFRLPKELSVFEKPADWPEKGTWSQYADETIELLDRFFSPSNQQSENVWALLKEGARQMAKFDAISPDVSRRDFLDALFERWDGMEVETEQKNKIGVSLLHAEAARGLPFKVIFLIGLDEKVFPRIICEDPFLRDDARLALNITLGHKIGQKSTALEEERLLFELFTEAASEKLYLIYQRSDEDGNVVGASPFLRMFAEKQKIDWELENRSVHRSLLTKVKNESPAYLSTQNIVLGYMAAGHSEEALRFVRCLGENEKPIRQGMETRLALQNFHDPGKYDACIGSQPLPALFHDGKISASALEMYGQCPYKYFAMRILDLKALEEYAIEESLPADKKGEAIHKFLERFYRQLTLDGKNRVPNAFPDDLFDRVFEAEMGSLSAQQLNLHPVIWNALKINIREMLHCFVRNDLEFCFAHHIQPTHFEKEYSGKLGPPFGSLEWKGRLDRVDIHEDEFRVIDYKTGRLPRIKNVVTAAMSGFRSQAPLYILMAHRMFGEKGNVLPVSFAYVYTEEGKTLELTAEVWGKNRATILKTIARQIGFIQEGNFIMMPDDQEPYCTHCDVSQICRKYHTVSRIRSRTGEGKKLWDVREAGQKKKTTKRMR